MRLPHMLLLQKLNFYKFLCWTFVSSIFYHTLMYFLTFQKNTLLWKILLPSNATLMNKRFYLGYLAFSATSLLFICIFKNKTLILLASLKSELLIERNRRERLIFFYTSLALIIIYSFKLNLGFYHAGIAGWTYENNFDEPFAGQELDQYPRYINQIFNLSNIKHLPQEHNYINTTALFFHFSDGSNHLINYNITPYVFDQLIFDRLGRQQRGKDIFNILKLSCVTTKDDFFLKYPKHSPYMHIDLSNLPDMNKLTNVSNWNIKLYINKREGIFRIIDLKKRWETSNVPN